MKNYFLVLLFLVCLKVIGQNTVADSLLQVGNFQEAIEIYKLNKNDDFKVARAYVQMGDVYAALDAYRDGFKKDSMSVQPRFEFARLALGNNDPVTAFNTLMDLLTDYPENASYHYYIGKAYKYLGNDKDAISAFSTSVHINKSYRAARIELIKLFIRKRRFNQAIESSLPALKLYPNDIKVNSLIAQAYLGAKRYDKAIIHFELLFSIGYDSEFNRKNLAWSYFNDGQWQLAIDNYELYNRDYEADNSLVYFVMSQSYLKLDKLKLAQDYIEQSISFKTPELHQEYLQLATIYARQKDYKNAFYATKTAKKEKPIDDLIGYQYVLAGDYYFEDKKKKLQLYEEFVKDYPESSYHEIATARASDLRREIFLDVKK